MFRNQYDNDVTVWSPQGRIFQVEYAMEAVKQGSITVGLKSRSHAVLVALSRSESDTNDLQRKIMPVDTHLGMSIAGLTADAKTVCRYLRTECMTYRHSYSADYPIQRLVNNLGIKMQATTQRYDRRPYGVGMLVAGYDVQGAHIFQVMPSANVLNCKAMAIGSRSQSARTYLERYLESFEDCSKDEIICHGIQAIRGSLGSESGSNIKISVAIVGNNEPFRTLSDMECAEYLELAKTLGKPAVLIDDPVENMDSTFENHNDSDDGGQGGSGANNANRAALSDDSISVSGTEN